MERLTPKDFLKAGETHPIIDVRSPKEYAQGHIPGALNIPIFENHERDIVGILYKNKGREEAIRRGLEIVGPKMLTLLEEAKTLADSGEILVHCWRGGMRSSSVAWLFESSGIKVKLLERGYKNYRSYVQSKLLDKHQLLVLGGLTGSGKTQYIKALEQAGEPVIDLEGLANHRGSAFGGAGLFDQPSTEHFENLLFQLIQEMPPGPIWVEDESRRLGSLFLPEKFYRKMRSAPVIYIEVDQQEREEILIGDYSKLPKSELAFAIQLLRKRVGGLTVKHCLEALEQDDFLSVVQKLLPYYDKLYKFGLRKRSEDSIYPLDLSGLSGSDRVKSIIALKEKIKKMS